MITLQEALEQSRHFYDITKQALEITDIKSRLQDFGEVEMVGSYLYGLMGKADVDYHIYTKTKPDINSVADLMAEYLKTKYVIKAFLVNYTVFPPMHTWSPPGIWLGLKIDIGGELVNMDIWFLRREDEHQDEFAIKMPKEWYKKLSPEQKVTIVYLKALSYKKYLEREYMSTEIYRAVVLGGVSSAAELETWGKSN